MAIAAILWIGARRGEISWALVFDPQAWWLDLLLGVGMTGVLLGTWSLGRSLTTFDELEQILGESLADLSPSDLTVLAVISGVAEELFFRGAVLESWGWLPSSILFALLHAGPGKVFRIWAFFAFFAALLFAGATLYRGNLAAAILAHVLTNGIQLHRLHQQRVEGSSHPGESV